MKKQIIISLLLISVSAAANAESKTFTSKADTANARRALEEAELQRDVDKLKASQELVEELKISNKINTEISTKLDKLLESSDANNLLMETLLKRTE